ncbi:MAG: hypothetical protein LUG99_00870 [Lachnospiraceae bacterium]|nr:hypothetical protein [Lachnospiraceae bacterium]
MDARLALAGWHPVHKTGGIFNDRSEAETVEDAGNPLKSRDSGNLLPVSTDENLPLSASPKKIP